MSFVERVTVESAAPGIGDVIFRKTTGAWAVLARPATLGCVLLSGDGANDPTWGPRYRTASTTWDPASTADAAMTSTTVTVTGAVVGDVVAVGFSVAIPAGGVLGGAVTATNTVTVTLFNKTGGVLDLASGTIRADVWH